MVGYLKKYAQYIFKNLEKPITKNYKIHLKCLNICHLTIWRNNGTNKHSIDKQLQCVQVSSEKYMQVLT